MDIRNIKAIDLSYKTGIGKSSISQWLSGKYEAKQDKIYILAKVLNVDEAWLMGLDVPMEKKLSFSHMYEQLPKNRKKQVIAYTKQQYTDFLKSNEDIIENEEISTYTSLFNSLDDDGKELAIDNLKALQKKFSKKHPNNNQDVS
ncbi:helix-turn-helix domain-containing protein [Vagococcus sp. BWB3-3]|uniref:Helix-turn-helix domain-containing protein n=2 Tax=Vagococcus allomyrinae TaxID=2794353 RepID=A0A940SVK1_9ENTE|nr:helix-turn-helix domain-containing protein [Vagococcus allomyrinae]